MEAPEIPISALEIIPLDEVVVARVHRLRTLVEPTRQLDGRRAPTDPIRSLDHRARSRLSDDTATHITNRALRARLDADLRSNMMLREGKGKQPSMAGTG